MERETERFRDCEALKERSFTNRYWNKYMSRHGLDFSTRKSDQKSFTDEEIVHFKCSWCSEYTLSAHSALLVLIVHFCAYSALSALLVHLFNFGLRSDNSIQIGS